MKVIVQIMPNELDQITSDISSTQKKKYEYDPETYSYFLYEVYEKQFKKFIEVKTGKSIPEFLGRDQNAEFNPKSPANIIGWSIKKQKYLPEFHEKRDKFYLYNGFFYSYTFMGDDNVGHVIEIVRYEDHEIVEHLNELMGLYKRKLINRLFNTKKPNRLRLK